MGDRLNENRRERKVISEDLDDPVERGSDKKEGQTARKVKS